MPFQGLKYHGWIYIQKTPGFNDEFFVNDKDNKNLYMGVGAEGAQKSCDYFEKTLKLGPVKLLAMGVLGYRVYTDEDEKKG